MIMRSKEPYILRRNNSFSEEEERQRGSPKQDTARETIQTASRPTHTNEEVQTQSMSLVW